MMIPKGGDIRWSGQYINVPYKCLIGIQIYDVRTKLFLEVPFQILARIMKQVCLCIILCMKIKHVTG